MPVKIAEDLKALQPAFENDAGHLIPVLCVYPVPQVPQPPLVGQEDEEVVSLRAARAAWDPSWPENLPVRPARRARAKGKGKGKGKGKVVAPVLPGPPVLPGSQERKIEKKR